MSTTLRAQVSLPNVNGVPADTVTNTWHAMSNLSDEVGDAGLFFNELAAFYDTIDVFLASTLGTTATIKIYDLSQPEPRTPILENTINLTLGAGAPLPHEVACCVSFMGAGGSGVNMARRRGRIFLGPLDSAVLDDSLGQAILQTSTITAIAGAAEDLMTAGGTSNFEWATFSPTTAGAAPWSEGELLASTHQVVAGFVDNSFDTIRSRGIDPTTRVSWP